MIDCIVLDDLAKCRVGVEMEVKRSEWNGGKYFGKWKFFVRWKFSDLGRFNRFLQAKQIYINL